MDNGYCLMGCREMRQVGKEWGDQSFILGKFRENELFEKFYKEIKFFLELKDVIKRFN